MEQAPKVEDASSGTSALSAGLGVQYPPELIGAMVTMAKACERSIPPKREIVPDDAVWLSIYCAVASCPNSARGVATGWADEGLIEYRKRFR